MGEPNHTKEQKQLERWGGKRNLGAKGEEAPGKNRPKHHPHYFQMFHV